MLPFVIDPDLPRPLREIVIRAMDLPRVSQVVDYIAVKCRLKRRELRRHLHSAMLRDEEAFVGLLRHLRRSGVRNPWHVSYHLRQTAATASDQEIIGCFSQADFESGHAAMEMTRDLGELRASLEPARAAEIAHVGARRDYLRAVRLEHECDLLIGRRQCGASSTP